MNVEDLFATNNARAGLESPERSRNGSVVAFDLPRRSVNRVFLHCSASDDSAMVGKRLVDEIRTWHRKRGFSDVGYHFLIDKEGAVLPGRNLERIPAAQRGHNRHSIAVMVHGLEEFPDNALSVCRQLCAAINLAVEGRVTFHGHCEVAPHKTCPVFDYRGLLGLDRFGRLP